MATSSAHFNMTKPATTDYYNIGVFNDNTDIIDTQMYNNQVSAAKVMVGATANDDGESGRVPVPLAGDQDKYLKGDGTWGTPSGGGGGAGADEMTLAEYNELTEQQKNDGTIRFIPENPYGIITDVDMSTITNLSENQITVTPSADEIEIDFNHNVSSSIGGTFYLTTVVDVTNYDYIKYDLTTGVCYNSLHSDTNPLRNLGIGLCRTAPSSWQYAPNVTWAVSNIYDVSDINSTFTDEVIDVSELTGQYYFVIAFVAWEATISNLKLATAGGYPSQIKYMSKTYADGTGGSGGSSAEQDILYIASSMSESQINVDLTAYDEYIIYANDVLVTQQIPQGNSFPKDVLAKIIADRTNLAMYGYSSAACTYTLTTSGLTKLSASGGYAITMIVGIKFGSGGGSSSASYSTTEQEIGTWIDGSTVYEKVISISNISLSSGSYETVDTITGLDTIISCNGYVVEGNLKYTLNDITLRVIQDGTSVKLYSPSGVTWAISSGAIIIRYIKASS